MNHNFYQFKDIIEAHKDSEYQCENCGESSPFSNGKLIIVRDNLGTFGNGIATEYTDNLMWKCPNCHEIENNCIEYNYHDIAVGTTYIYTYSDI